MPKTFAVAAILTSLLTAAQIVTAQDSAASAPQPHIAYLDKSKAIYVTEFETSPETAPTAQSKDAPNDGGSVARPKPNGTGVESVASSARITKLLSESLVREIKKAGYKPKLLGARDPLPDEGILVTGVFTQLSKDGRLRRAAIGPDQASGVDVQLYVATMNLLRSAKPMYENVKQETNGASASSPIRLNPEVATLKFSVAGNPADQAVKKTAEQIATELQRLTLQAESEGLAGSDDPLNKYSKP